jgi:hypothetical protein
MRTALCAVTALALCCTVPAHATTVRRPPAAACAMTDPTGDVTFTPTGQSMAADHVDLRGVDFSIGAKTIDVTFHVIANTDLRLGEWRLMFNSGKTPVYVLASNGAWLEESDDDFPPGFRGGVVGGKATNGTGSYDAYGDIRVHLPLTAFGKAAPRRGTVLSDIHVKAMEKFFSQADEKYPRTEIGPVDTAAWPYRITVGGACRS